MNPKNKTKNENRVPVNATLHPYVASWSAAIKPETNSAPIPNPMIARPVITSGRVLNINSTVSSCLKRALMIGLRF